MKSKIERFIVENQLLSLDDVVLVGLSGGADSVVLLDVLIRLHYRCIAAHCNFHLRGEESNRDQAFVEELCRKYEIPLLKVDFQTEEYAKENSLSIEMAARELRYNWFEEQRIANGAEYIAIAHHQDDSVETILLNLIRGTGIRGLTGIASKNGKIIRPLLSVSRKEIEAYLCKRNISYVNDSTNAEDIFTRNSIRLNILPMMEELNPSVKKAIDSTSKHLVQVRDIYLAYIEKAKNELLVDNKIFIVSLLSYTSPDAILYEILTEYGFNSDTVADLYRSLTTISGKIFYSDTHEILKDREYLILRNRNIKNVQNEIIEINLNDTSLSYPIKMSIINVEYTPEFKIEKSNRILYLDVDKIKLPLSLRKWKLGDWFIPFGMKSKKKLSDYFSDNKFSLFDKENTWLLCSDEDIVWVISHRSDNRYRIDSDTKHILCIHLD